MWPYYLNIFSLVALLSNEVKVQGDRRTAFSFRIKNNYISSEALPVGGSKFSTTYYIHKGTPDISWFLGFSVSFLPGSNMTLLLLFLLVYVRTVQHCPRNIRWYYIEPLSNSFLFFLEKSSLFCRHRSPSSLLVLSSWTRPALTWATAPSPCWTAPPTVGSAPGNGQVRAACSPSTDGWRFS